MPTEKREKNAEFAVRLTQLRHEYGYSQKKVASDLGVSQALLSHYEKGIRECGLNFVIKCAKYYGVSTDYILGMSDNRFNSDTSYFNGVGEGGQSGGDLTMLLESTKTLIDTAVAVKPSDKAGISEYLKDYYMLCLYRGALTLAKAGVMPSDLFKFDYNLGHELATAAIAVLDSRFAFIEDKSRTGKDFSDNKSIKKLIEDAENYILTNFIA